jgi:hypothetical protein
VRVLGSAATLLFTVLIGTGCAHAGAGTEADEEAAVAAGVRAALRLYLPANEPLSGPYCVEVDGPVDFERGVVAALGASGILAVSMRECATNGRDALVWVKISFHEWTDIVAHSAVDIRGTVETRPDERANFRLSWWKANFRASLVYQQGHWAVDSADDLGRI